MNQPIFLIAFPRSGSTWVSTVMGWAPGVSLNLEPLRMARDCGVRGLRPWRFCGAKDKSPFEETALRTPLREAGNNCLVAKMVHACFKAEWFAERYGAKIVLLQREPLGQISSWVRNGTFSVYPVTMLLKRVVLQRAVRDRLPDVCKQADDWRQRGKPYELMAAWWSLLEALYLHYVGHHGWPLVYYEDFCTNPTAEFKTLFAQCGLTFDQDVSWRLRGITKSRRNSNPGIRVKETVCRNSRGMLGAGERRLTARQQRRIKAVVRSFVGLDH